MQPVTVKNALNTSSFYFFYISLFLVKLISIFYDIQYGFTEFSMTVIRLRLNKAGGRKSEELLEIWAIYTEFLPSSQTIPALPTASNARSKEKKTFYSVSWIKRQ